MKPYKGIKYAVSIKGEYMDMQSYAFTLTPAAIKRECARFARSDPVKNSDVQLIRVIK